MISCFRLASKPLSQPWPSVCWGTVASPNAISTQCVWASPLATLAWTTVGWRGNPNLFLCLPLCCTSHIRSLHLLFTLSATSLLSCLFTFYIPVLSSPAANIFHSERKILQWKPGRAKDIHPVHAGQDGRDYKYYLCLAVNIFIREWIICWLCACLQKHACLDAQSRLWSAERWQQSPSTWCKSLSSKRICGHL